MRKIVSMALILGMFSMTGCYGKFKLTSGLNGVVTNISKGEKPGTGKHWVAEGLFLLFAILPVYAIAILGDAIIFNSVEFWTGDNPLSNDLTNIEKGQHQAVVKVDRANNTYRVYLFENHKPVTNLLLKPNASGNMVAYTPDGKVYTALHTSNGYTLSGI
ncbi:MAG TPA: DUF3332 family protein [Elusimicrobiales bacterium]|nr:DUF3332 family protein [Elusimicrobiales bacterium]